MPIHEQLELTARVAAAEPLVPLWDLHHPARPHLTTSDEIADALRAGSPHDNDRLLLRLAELAHVDGGGSLDAAAVLAKLVLPGVGAGCGDVLLSGRGPRWISTLQRCYGSPAGRSRTGRPNGWRRRSRGECSERPSTSWAAAARAQPGLPPSLPEIRPGGLTMPSTREPDREAAEDLADLLRWARSNGVLSADDSKLLTTLVRVSSQLPASPITRHGLLSAQVSQTDAVQLGVGESTVRRHVARILNQLREAGPAYLTAIAS